jgi:hypothetical protein
MKTDQHHYPLKAGTELLWKNVFWLVFFNICTIIIGIITYNGSFLFWKDALSNLGSTVNLSGEHNFLSPLFFGAGLVVCGLLCFRIAAIWSAYQILPRFRLFSFLMKMAGTGYLLMIAPCNLINTVHVLGSILLFGSFWLYMVLLIRDLSIWLKHWRVLIFMTLLNATLLPYAFTYVILRTPVKQLYQKIAVLGMLISLLLIVRMLNGLASDTYDR